MFCIFFNVYPAGSDIFIAIVLISPTFSKITKPSINMLIVSLMLRKAASKFFHRHTGFCSYAVVKTVTPAPTLDAAVAKKRKASFE